MRKLRVGIIGCGMIANAKHLPAILRYQQAHGNVELAGLCGSPRSPERPAETAERFGLHTAGLYTDDLRMLDELELDLVHVCTSNRSHAAISIRALERGVSVLCEKPMAINRFEAMAMFKAAKKSGAVLSVAYQHRFRPDVWQLKTLCETGVFGEIYSAKATAVRRRGIPAWGEFLNPVEQGGGALIDLGSHALDMALWLMQGDQVKTVLGATFHQLPSGGQPKQAQSGKVELAATALLTMKSGHSLSLDTAWALNSLQPEGPRCQLFGSKAGADMHDSLRLNSFEDKVPLQQQFQMDTFAPGYYSGELSSTHDREIEVFYQAVMGLGELVVTPLQALRVSQVIDAIYASARLGRAIDLDDPEWYLDVD